MVVENEARADAEESEGPPDANGAAPAARCLPGPVEPAHPALLRQIRQTDEWLRRRENLEKYPGQIVVIYGSEVLGHGQDCGTAVGMAEAKVAAMPEAERPPEEDVAQFHVPDLVTPERPLP